MRGSHRLRGAPQAGVGHRDRQASSGVRATLLSACLLGTTPVLGKLAITAGFSPLATVALRTGLAAALLLVIVLVFYPSYVYIYPVGLAGCLLAGLVNGTGSLLYYLALSRIDASLGQLLFSLYPFFVAMWLMLDRQMPSRLTQIRIVAAMLAVMLLVFMPGHKVDAVGMGLMLGAGILYALHLPINQRVLYEVPAPTVTLYTLLAMSLITIPAYVVFDGQWPAANAQWLPVLSLAGVTFGSRLLLFLAVKRIGGMQTALLGLAELLVTLLLGALWLGERLSGVQWIGVLVLVGSLLLAHGEPAPAPRIDGKSGWLAWLHAPRTRTGLFGPYE